MRCSPRASRMKLTVLGNTSRYLAPLAGGSSYLVEDDDVRILLDCGSGGRAALAALGVESLDAVVVSHFHHDHVSEIVPIRRAMKDDGVLVVPPGEEKRLDSLAHGFAFQGAFDAPLLVEGAASLDVRGIRLRFARTQHNVPSFATRIGDFVYASDGAPCDTLAALARGCGTLLMHALLPTVEAGSEHARIHATAETAGALAAQVGARRLMLSHRHWGSGDAEMREAAAKSFGLVELARDDAAYDL